MRERARFFYVRHFYNRAIRLAPRSEDPYATHLPVLSALGALVRPKRVIEFGSGLVSTPAFLNCDLFPGLKSLVSLENDPAWYEQVREHIGHDPRLQLLLIDGPMKDVVAGCEIAEADLVFVDDYDSAPPPLPGRGDTIAALAAIRPTSVPIVIHDFELRHLRRRVTSFDHVFRFDVLNPQTGVVWNGHWRCADRLPAVNRMIRRHCTSVPSRDADRWARIVAALPA